MPNGLSGTDLSAFERLLTEISTRFVSVAAANVDAEITAALRSLVEFLAIDRSTLFQWSGDGRILENTHQWVVEGCACRSNYRPSCCGSSRAARSSGWAVAEP